MSSSTDKIIKRKSTRGSILSTLQKVPQPKRITAPTSEVTTEFLKRQKEYDNLNKYHLYDQSKDNIKVSLSKSNFHNIKDAVNQAKLKFFESTPQRKNFINSTLPNYQQQYNSIRQIADQFRNQKKFTCFTQNEKKQPTKQWNLKIILMVVVPIICIIRVIFALYYAD